MALHFVTTPRNQKIVLCTQCKDLIVDPDGDWEVTPASMSMVSDHLRCDNCDTRGVDLSSSPSPVPHSHEQELVP